MITNATLSQSLTSRLFHLRDNTIVIDNPDKLDCKNIQDGVLIVYATWSGPAIMNCNQAIQLLYEHSYTGQIIVVDIDCLTPDFQLKVLGQVCRGWGEIFMICRGQISKEYLGKDSYSNFKTDYEQQSHRR